MGDQGPSKVCFMLLEEKGAESYTIYPVVQIEFVHSTIFFPPGIKTVAPAKLTCVSVRVHLITSKWKIISIS